MRLILALILAAGVVSAQTTVNITNSLIGPVTQNFSNTQVNVSQAVITGAVVNASVTNSFSPTTFITNEVTVGGTTVNNTNNFTTIITNNVSVAGVVVTNITSFSGTFSFTTNLYFQANGLNVVTPSTESTNVTGTWTITIGTNSAAMLYTQTGAITSIVTALGSNVTTNDVALAFIGLRGNGSSVTWPTNQWVWASGAAPTVTSNQWNMYYIQLWKNERHVATIGDTP